MSSFYFYKKQDILEISKSRMRTIHLTLFRHGKCPRISEHSFGVKFSTHNRKFHRCFSFQLLTVQSASPATCPSFCYAQRSHRAKSWARIGSFIQVEREGRESVRRQDGDPEERRLLETFGNAKFKKSLFSRKRGI
jgi:hypothetical protein